MIHAASAQRPRRRASVPRTYTSGRRKPGKTRPPRYWPRPRPAAGTAAFPPRKSPALPARRPTSPTRCRRRSNRCAARRRTLGPARRVQYVEIDRRKPLRKNQQHVAEINGRRRGMKIRRAGQPKNLMRGEQGQQQQHRHQRYARKIAPGVKAAQSGQRQDDRGSQQRDAI